jgi:peptide chain release factor
MPDFDEALTRRMAKLGLREEDLTENFIRGTGAGGQKINKTSSTVQLSHGPSGVDPLSARALPIRQSLLGASRTL